LQLRKQAEEEAAQTKLEAAQTKLELDQMPRRFRFDFKPNSNSLITSDARSKKRSRSCERRRSALTTDCP
jgi:hypothetical protein